MIMIIIVRNVKLEWAALEEFFSIVYAEKSPLKQLQLKKKEDQLVT